MQSARRPERRRTVRVPFAVPLIVQCRTLEGETLQLMASTQSLSAHGALMLLNAPVKPGQAIRLYNDVTSESVECYVTSVRDKRERRFVGIGFATPADAEANFWHIVFPKAGTRQATRSSLTGGLVPAGVERLNPLHNLNLK